MDQSDPMIEYMRMRDIRMEEENRKRWEEREEIRRVEKREERIMLNRQEEERRADRNLARDSQQQMMTMMISMLHTRKNDSPASSPSLPRDDK